LLQDVKVLVQSFARTARKERRDESHPRRAELMTILTDVRAHIDRINAPT
jgi:hypothetical protein